MLSRARAAVSAVSLLASLEVLGASAFSGASSPSAAASNQAQAAHAQEQLPPVPRFRAGVELMVLDVSVLDEKRIPVRGLTAGDFTVLEDGKPQKIQSFSAIDLPDVVHGQSAPWLREVPSDVRSNQEDENRRVIALVLDDGAVMSAADLLWAMRVGERIVEELSPDDLVSVVYTWEKRSGQEFTHDRARLLAAVHRFNARMPGQIAGPAAVAGSDAAIDAMAEICYGLAALPGRKTIFYVSPGLPFDLAEGAQATQISQSNPSGDTQGMYSRLLTRVSGFLAAAHRANVNIYGIDPGGLRAPAPDYNALTGVTKLDVNPNSAGREFLKTVSSTTGGFAVVDTNDFSSNITQVFRENRSYYLLGYTTSNQRAAGKYRKIEVKVNRPGATVRSRSGYYEPGPPDKRAKKTAPAAPFDAALTGFLPKSDLPLQMVAAPFAVPGKVDAAVALVVGVRHLKPMRATRLVAEVALRASAFSPDGRQRASRREQVPVTLNTVGFAETAGYEILTRLELKPGRYYLRLAAETRFRGIQLAPSAPAVAMVAQGQDMSPKNGSVYCDLDVPDFQNEALSISGVVLSVNPPVASGPKDRLKSIVPIVPTTIRDFTGDDTVTCFLQVYQGVSRTLVPANISAQVIDLAGAVVFAAADVLGTERFAKRHTADCNLTLPIAGFKQGPHVLRLEVKAGERTVRREVRFEVR